MRADGLRRGDGGDHPLVADALHLPHEVVGIAVAGIGFGGDFGYDGSNVAITRLGFFQGLHRLGQGTEGAAKRKAYTHLFHAYTPNSFKML
ncbi:hypothetical protein SDC9_101722 [bioreactor metagenome]|uniref:Uncharacterized protein n=1 Tax=bioreactor metagenome TaxID=1076179 RepID=A0A645AP47_9ZZZZ